MKKMVFVMALLASVASFTSAFASDETEEKLTETGSYASFSVADDSELEKTDV